METSDDRQGLIVYRNLFLRSKDPKLSPIRAKLQQIAADERRSHEGTRSIEELVGKINPNEPDVIQELRRTLRTQGKSPNTEKAYVKWVKRFMKARCDALARKYPNAHREFK